MRLAWLDTAKAYGMILVYYGHFVESLHKFNPVAYMEYKFIYSFHMPLFFILCGYVHKDRDISFKDFLKYEIATRLIPFLFFNVLALVFWGSIDVFVQHEGIEHYSNFFPDLLLGHPPTNFITWFLICLFTVELIHFFFKKYLKTDRQLITYSLIFLTVGWFINLNSVQEKLLVYVPVIKEIVQANFWYINEALVAYPFYLFGIFLKKHSVLEDNISVIKKVLIIAMCLAFVILTFNLNSLGGWVVAMALGNHGNLILFVTTALAGVFFTVFLSQIISPNSSIIFIGTNTLILLGLNTFFMGVFDHLVPFIKGFLIDSHISVFAICGLATLVSLGICVPIINFLNKFFPQLVGKPKAKGPILRNLV